MEVKCIMKLIRSCIVSFSMYSKIPMPQFKWNDDDMKYMLVFFPWIGAVIGLLLMLWRYIYSHFGVADICYVCIGALIPIAVTGGFHIDGFMDTMDAFHSYKPREEKLAILKDSHIGAFADLNDTTAIPLKHLAMKKPAQKTINALSSII